MEIRQGNKQDVPGAFALIRELALYEKAPEEVDNTIESMIEDGFGDEPIFGFFVAEANQAIVGLALYYYRYSTWKGKCLYLEDIVVTESHRGRGIGKLLFDRIVTKVKEEKLKGISWQVLEWNEPAISFYKKLNAAMDGEWINCRMGKGEIERYV